MSFDLAKFFEDVFGPQEGEVVTVMYDLPHGDIKDNDMWKERRQMANDWRNKLAELADKWKMKVNTVLTYEATGANNADLPQEMQMGGEKINLESVMNNSTIVIAMPEFSATAPLYAFARKSDKLRIGSMPGVAKFMEETGLSADYKKIYKICETLEPYFEKAMGAEVTFSTGHKCYFDLNVDNRVFLDNAYLHRDVVGTDNSLSNLPSGEVFQVPNEAADSKTEGELPEKRGDQTIVYIIKNNKIVDIKGDIKEVEEMKSKYLTDNAWCNIAECAIGCNDKAKVTGVVLEDEKAGFHWAHGRSDHIGGTVGVKDFTSPSNVIHQDIVYAKDSPITCAKFEMIFKDNTKKTMIIDGVLQL